jgi:two-component system response regulator YesN
LIINHAKINQWNYYYLLPEQTLFNSLEQYRNMFFLVMLAGLIIGFLLLYILSQHNVRPFIQLGNQLKDSIIKREELQTTLDEQKPLLRNFYIRSLMLGRISSKDEMDYIKNFLNLTDYNRTYIVLYIATYPSEHQASPISAEEYAEDGALRYKYAGLYEQSIFASLQKHFGTPLYLFYPKMHNYSILLSFDNQLDKDAIHKEISRLFKEFHEEVLCHHSMWSIGGLGSKNYNLENIWKSYQQASEAVSYASNEIYYNVIMN